MPQQQVTICVNSVSQPLADSLRYALDRRDV